MVDYKYKDLFWKSHVDKQLKIATDDGLFTATNSDINWENFELTESLCSDSELMFGSCEASTVKFQIRNAFISLAGRWITITETLDGNIDIPFQYGRYKVSSDKPTADREYRDIVAYDGIHDILNADVTDWYNSVLPDSKRSMTMMQFRTSFLYNLGFSDIVPGGGLVNDDMIIKRTIKPEQLSGKDVITAICEINGCFGHMGRDGKFHYIYLPQDIMGLYPSKTLFPDHAPDYLPQAETGHLYPQSPKTKRLGNGAYISADYEDFLCKKINKVQVRQEENDIGGQFPKENVNNENSYIIEDNFLVYGKGATELDNIAKNIFEKITNVIYRPFSAECIGNPCIEVGDPIRLSTKYELIESYVFKRTLKGIQSLRDSYSADGEEMRSEKINSIGKSIIQLKGKTNNLTRTVDETKSEIEDVESGLTSAITQTAREIRTEIKDTKEGLESSITQTASNIRLEVKNETEGLSSRIDQTESRITQEVSDRKAEGGELSSKIEQTAGEIKEEVRARTEEGKDIKASLSLKIDNDDDGTIISLINGSADKIHFGANNMFTVSSPNFNVDENGKVEITGTMQTGNEDNYAALRGNGLLFYSNGYLSGEIYGSLKETASSYLWLLSRQRGISFSIADSSDNISSKYIISNNFDVYDYRHNFFDNVKFNDDVSLNNILFGDDSYIKSGTAAGMEVIKIKAQTVQIDGELEVSGAKNRVVKTKHYGNVKMNAFETAEAYFSDIGSGKISDGVCYIYFDPVFAETIDLNAGYQVFLTQTSKEKTDYVEKKNNYFIVRGEDGATFDWMITAKQKNYENIRMERVKEEGAHE